ncbi:MAG TPA: MBL fold metallo-hydrolase [Bryobacteraceae bacterium]|nr:MBL fold metallo-hydrolase [Bryobacteraceae bacterium]
MAPAFWQRVSADIKRDVEPAPRKPQVAEWPAQGLHATWIGLSTVMLSIDGFRILTDPVFSTRIGISLGIVTLGLKRLIAPAAPLADLPRPDLILLSHAHMDHFDIPSLRTLEHPQTTVVTATNTSDLLRPKRYASVQELRWNERAQVGPASIRAFQVNHWGARMRNDTYRSYNGYLIESGRYRVVFGGDTAYTENFRFIRTSKPVDLAIMPIGAYDPWIRAHCNPEQAMAMANHAGGEHILPIHHRTFDLSREPRTEPLERLLAAAGPSPDRVIIRDFGQEFHSS